MKQQQTNHTSPAIAITTTLALVLVASFFLSPLASANSEVSEHIKSALETADTYTEGDGITKWEKRVNGDIVKHFPNGKVNVIYKENGDTIFYDQKGIKVATVEGKGTTYYESDGKTVNTFAGEDKIIEYQDGELKTIKSLSGENKGEITARKLSDTNFVILIDGQNISIGTDGNNKVNSLKVFGFGRDYSYDNTADTTKEEATKDGELVWYALDGEKEEGSIWNSFIVFLIKRYTPCSTPKKAQECYNKEFVI